MNAWLIVKIEHSQILLNWNGRLFQLPKQMNVSMIPSKEKHQFRFNDLILKEVENIVNSTLHNSIKTNTI
jgi:hypothetical protein